MQFFLGTTDIMPLSLAQLLFVACCVAYTAAHMCLIYPHQRGSMADLNSVGMVDEL